MPKYKCIKKCFYDNRLWTPGETLEVHEGDVACPHFKLASKVVEVKPAPVAEVKTFTELHREEAAKALESVGRSEQAAKRYLAKSKKAKTEVMFE